MIIESYKDLNWLTDNSTEFYDVFVKKGKYLLWNGDMQGKLNSCITEEQSILRSINIF